MLFQKIFKVGVDPALSFKRFYQSICINKNSLFQLRYLAYFIGLENYLNIKTNDLKTILEDIKNNPIKINLDLIKTKYYEIKNKLYCADNISKVFILRLILDYYDFPTSDNDCISDLKRYIEIVKYSINNTYNKKIITIMLKLEKIFKKVRNSRQKTFQYTNNVSDIHRLRHYLTKNNINIYNDIIEYYDWKYIF